MPTRSAAPQFELLFASPLMGAFTRADPDGTMRKYIGGSASSTMEDLKESIIMPEAQQMMVDKLHSVATKMNDVNGGMTAWLNHDYNIPEDCLGAFTAAALTTRVEDGKKYIDLDVECRLTETNPRATAAYAQVLDGIRHGWSIGAYFTDTKWASDDPDDENFWKMLVYGVELLEISLVGIPANQRAWVRDVEAAKAYAKAESERITIESYGRQQRRGFVQRAIVERPRWGAMGLALADDLRIRAKQPHLEPSNIEALTLTADALELRDDGQPLSPDDSRDRLITDGITHLAKAVGHGLCIKSATSVSKALLCMSAAISPNGGAAEPLGTEANETWPNEGDESPEPDPGEPGGNQMAIGIRKLEPKAGDIIVLSGMNATPEQVDTLRANWGAMDAGRGVSIWSLPDGSSVDLMLADKRAQLAGAEAAIATAADMLAAATQRATEFDEQAAAATLKLNAELSAIETDIGFLKAERDAFMTRSSDEEAAAVADRSAVQSELEAVRAEIETARAERDAAKAERETVIADIAARKAERLGRLSKSANPNDLLATQGESYMKPEHYGKTYTEQMEALKRQAGGAPPIPKTGRDIALAQEQKP